MNARPPRTTAPSCAYQNGEVKRLTVVARLSQEARQVGRFASYAMISTANLFGALPSALRRRKAVGPDPVSVVSFLLRIRRLARALAFESAPKRSATVYNACDGSPPHARTDAATILARSDRASLRVAIVVSIRNWASMSSTHPPGRK